MHIIETQNRERYDGYTTWQEVLSKSNVCGKNFEHERHTKSGKLGRTIPIWSQCTGHGRQVGKWISLKVDST